MPKEGYMPTELSTAIPTLLFIDDEPEYREEFTYSLRGQNYHLLVEENADKALALLKEKHHEIAVIITDYNMPGTNGVEFLRIVCEQWPQITRIMCTNISDIDIAKSAINTGQVLAYFNKPWTEDELIATIRRAVDTHQEILFNKKIKKLYATLEDNDHFKEELFNILKLETSDLSAAAISCVDFIQLEFPNESQTKYLNLCKFNNKLIRQLMKNVSAYLELRKNTLAVEMTPCSITAIQDEINEALVDYIELGATIEWKIAVPIETCLQTQLMHLVEVVINMITHFMRNDKNHMQLSLSQHPTDSQKIAFNISAQAKIRPDQQAAEYTRQLLVEKNTADDSDEVDHTQLYGSYFGLYIAKLLANKIGITLSYEENQTMLFKLSVDLSAAS